MTTAPTRRAVMAGGLALAAAPAGAQEGAYPSRTIRLVVPFAAGGATDTLARLLAETLNRDLGQQVIIENTPGAGGGVGGKRVLSAPADGYTLLIGNIGTLGAGIMFYKVRPYDPPADFTAIASVADAPQMLVTRPNVPVTDLDGFVAYAKANESTINWGAGGIGSGSYLGSALINNALGLKLQIVNYRSSGGALNDLMAGNVSFLIESTSGSLQHVQSGTVRGVAVLQKTRLPGAPDMRSVVESRYPNLEYSIWNMVVVRKGTPDAIVQKISASVRKAMDDPAFKARCEQLGLERPKEVETTPAGAQALLASEAKRWEPLVKSLGVTIE